MYAPKHSLMYARIDAYPRIVCIRTPNLSNAMVSLCFQAGSRNAPPGKDGLPHLFEHLFLVNNARQPSKAAYLAFTERQGFLYNAYTAKSIVNYHIACPPQREIDALQHLIVSYRTTKISEKNLVNEKEILLNEERSNHASIPMYLSRLADRGLWANGELSRDVLGTLKTLHSITLEDINSFRKMWYQPNNMTVIILTPIEIQTQKITNTLNIFGHNKCLSFPPLIDSDIRRSVREKRPSDLVHVAISYRNKGLSFSERASMQLLVHYLAGGWSGQLIQKLRLEQGLTYWIKPDVYHAPDAGYVRFSYAVKKVNIEKSIAAIKNEVNAVRLGQIREHELTHFKQSLVTKNLITGSNPYETLTYYGRIAFSTEREVRLYDNFLQALEQCTAKDIQETSRNYLNEKESSIALIGPL